MSVNSIHILFIADIVGDAGIRIVQDNLKRIRQENDIHLCIANGENASNGNGLTTKAADRMFDCGIDVLTSGNHYWDKRDYNKKLGYMNVVRPVNYPAENEGKGTIIMPVVFNWKIAVVNVQGRTFMQPIDCPFKAMDREIEQLRKQTKIIFVDMHAEATAEKQAMGYYLDGRVSAVIGTHTHVQSADECILPKGTAYITDAGMTGPIDSVIGLKKEVALKRFIHQTPYRYEVATGKARLNGVLLHIDSVSGMAERIERIAFSEK